MKKLVLVLGTIFFLLIIESESYQCGIKSDSFLNMENVVFKDYKFVQNGIKLEYTTNNDVDIEKKNIVNNLEKIENLKITEVDSNISAVDKYINYNITLYKEEKTRVEIVLINNDNNLKTSDLNYIVQKLKGDNSIEERYYYFIKGKEKFDGQEISSEIMNQIKKDSVQSLDITNGKVTKALLKDETVINIGQINYNTGEYLIIGTPVIFTTY